MKKNECHFWKNEENASWLCAVGDPARGRGRVIAGTGTDFSRGIVTPLASANLVFDGEPECLKVARENGDPDKGASTFLLEAPSGCVVPRTITPRKNN